MCLGVPLQVLSVDAGGNALCRGNSAGAMERPVTTLLLDQPARVGDWLLVHIDVAIRSLDAAEARLISDALTAVDAAARGLPFEHLLGDLANREPELPAHLRPGSATESSDA
jgi:hydrogenase expression/formation protein HypC